ncbi:cupin domain-containing protein [Spongiactinospora sp. TRM90649]|uniref:cupin domain-containing protein n=1 Tax=Spongiactinospora sp. TRM90649 TaxID=3031114 RepID=UPI0023F6AE5A|nr:cupin domain-containing protein [Spongiactinospora sp. TRM90649]MDF5759169.1 cupin domain-containing protein [Spongiactinospora sp. TRM90649]
MRREPHAVPTMVFGWGSIKWHVTPGSVAGASSTLGEVIINPGKGHERHLHPESDEILYIIEGEGRQTVGDEPEFPVKAGDAVWIPRGVLHSTFNTTWRPLRIIATYTPGGAEAALRELPDFVELPPGEGPRWAVDHGDGGAQRRS